MSDYIKNPKPQDASSLLTAPSHTQKPDIGEPAYDVSHQKISNGQLPISDDQTASEITVAGNGPAEPEVHSVEIDPKLAQQNKDQEKQFQQHLEKHADSSTQQALTQKLSESQGPLKH